MIYKGHMKQSEVEAHANLSQDRRLFMFTGYIIRMNECDQNKQCILKCFKLKLLGRSERQIKKCLVNGMIEAAKYENTIQHGVREYIKFAT